MRPLSRSLCPVPSVPHLFPFFGHSIPASFFIFQPFRPGSSSTFRPLRSGPFFYYPLHPSLALFSPLFRPYSFFGGTVPGRKSRFALSGRGSDRQVLFNRTPEVTVVEMGVDLGGQDAFVSEQLLNLPDRGTAFEQVGCK